MKIVRFEIHSIRGIRQFAAEVDGRSIVITGPNGTGKSGIIDSLDFLFSGSIQRLSGTGTGDLSLDKHGKHVDDRLVHGTNYTMPREKRANASIRVESLRQIATQVTVATARYGEQFVGHTHLIKRLVQANGLRVRHDWIGDRMENKHRRQAGSDVRQG